jgi:hypothetical protein
MARYIDADALYKKLYPLDLADKRKYTINAKAVADAIANIPTADVVPKSEFNKTIAEWAYLHADVLNKLENAKAEVAREIFEEIEKLLYIGVVEHVSCIDAYVKKGYAELKKKYLPDTDDGNITAAEAIANFHEAAHEYYTDNNHCVVCGESVPEGRQVCGMCEVGMDTLKNYNKNNNQGG